MNIRIQPKIIIGSLIGIIGTITTLCVIFFPNFLNLQKNKIINYSINLDNNTNFINFINFLKNNQNKVIDLNLIYRERERISYSKQNNHNGIPLDEMIDHTFKGEQLISNIDDIGDSIVNSKYTYIGPYMRDIHRYEGGFSFWIKENNKDTLYLVIIPEDSSGNITYQWNLKKENDNYEIVSLSGIFFIEKIMEIDLYNNQTHLTYSKNWEINACKKGDCYGGSFVIILNPLNEREIKMLNY